MTTPTLEQLLAHRENVREQRRARCGAVADHKLIWRAAYARHCLHVLPGSRILEIGAAGGEFSNYLRRLVRDEVTIERISWRSPVNSRMAAAETLSERMGRTTYDHIIGHQMLSHPRYGELLALIAAALKPGGQFLFFENNHRNPFRRFSNALSRLSRDPYRERGVKRYDLLRAASAQGLIHLDIAPYDIVPGFCSDSFARRIGSKVYLFEHAPMLRELCGTVAFWGRKPGTSAFSVRHDLARRSELFRSVSVVLPCHNEAPNLSEITSRLLDLYRPYIHEIIVVDDNSTDRTGETALEIARREPLVKLITRTPPNGVGRALRDGYSAAAGRYILSMDCDFIQILPELRDLFEAVADGYDGAIGSRFSHESVLFNYPFAKIIGNRAVHLLIKWFLTDVRDVSNNLKLYRSDILKNLEIEEPHFAANLETGLKPLLLNYKIKEVPISWINRDIGMGSSTFKALRAGPSYFSSLLRTMWRARMADPFRSIPPETGKQRGIEGRYVA